MLKPSIVEEAQKFLDEGLPQREVFRRMGGRISRASIYRIAHGLRPDPADDDDHDPPSGPGVACPRCGHRVVVFPCPICAARARAALSRAEGIRVGDDEEDEPAVQLRPGQQARYEALRRGRAA